MEFQIDTKRTEEWQRKWDDSNAMTQQEWPGTALAYIRMLEDLASAAIAFDYTSTFEGETETLHYRSRNRLKMTLECPPTK